MPQTELGPSTGAKQLQINLHRVWGAEAPQGWDYQLHDELVANVDYRYHSRFLRDARAREWGFDITGDTGAGFGNYYIGAHAAVAVRAGFNVPRSFLTPLGPASRELHVDHEPPPPGQVAVYVALRGVGLATARFLPQDGNTFRDSPSVESKRSRPAHRWGSMSGMDRYCSASRSTTSITSTMSRASRVAITEPRAWPSRSDGARHVQSL